MQILSQSGSIACLSSLGVPATLVRDSVKEFGTFQQALSQRAVRQNDFLVTVLQLDSGIVRPAGILVDSISDERISGRVVPNALEFSVGPTMSCALDNIVDWRFADTWELVGGKLYRALWQDVAHLIRRRIEERLPFVFEWPTENEDEHDFKLLVRDMANLRHDEVRTKLAKGMQQQDGLAPTPQQGLDRCVNLNRHSIGTFAAEWCDAPMIQLLYESRHLANIQGRPLLNAAARRGNLDATRALAECGCDVNAIGVGDMTPLRVAATWGHHDVIKFLLAHNADFNHRDNSGQTALFHVSSVADAKLLVESGADVNAVSNELISCAQWHWEHGRVDVANYLADNGANWAPIAPRGSTVEETMAKGEMAIREYYAQHDPQELADIEAAWAVDYGYVLPIRTLPMAD